MLYSIAPPILVVMSLMGIIVFLVKKSRKMAGAYEREKEKEFNVPGQRLNPGMLSRRDQNNEVATGNKMKNGLLILLEKLIRKSRVIFLKLENVFMSWSNSLREKRKKRSENMDVQNEETEKETDILDKLKKYEPERRKVGGGILRVRNDYPETEKEKDIIRTMISRTAVEPRQKIETKDRLEKILIERIAANPKDSEAYERLGEYYFEVGNYEHSKECFKQVIKLDPRNIGVRGRMKKLERLLSK